MTQSVKLTSSVQFRVLVLGQGFRFLEPVSVSKAGAADEGQRFDFGAGAGACTWTAEVACFETSRWKPVYF